MSAFMGLTESRERESWGSHVMAVRSVESVGGQVVVVWADGVTTRHESALAVSTSTGDETMTTTCERKETMYRTAIARISCAKFQAGECVRVLWTHVHDGVDWYIVAPADATKGTVAYPAHHLESFVL